MFGFARQTDRMIRVVFLVLALLLLAFSTVVGVSPIFSQEDSQLS